VAVNGDVQVVLNNDNQLVTPSAVQFQSGGSVRVGQKAYQDRALQDDQNSFVQFKRRMGLQEGEYVPAARRKYNPEELAGELLKSLRGDAEGFLGHQIEAAVITVPAMFELVQAEATQRAANLQVSSTHPFCKNPLLLAWPTGMAGKSTMAFILFTISAVALSMRRLSGCVTGNFRCKGPTETIISAGPTWTRNWRRTLVKN
jgi:molecular chaperone DnaK